MKYQYIAWHSMGRSFIKLRGLFVGDLSPKSAPYRMIVISALASIMTLLWTYVLISGKFQTKVGWGSFRQFDKIW